MKRLLILLCAAPLLATAQAQPPDGPSDGKPPGHEKWKPKDRMRERMMENLPPELRERFAAAREKAMQDPRIQELKKKADAAGEEFRSAMRDAMMKADPDLAEQLKKFAGERGDRPNWGGKGNKDGRPPGFDTLSEGDRQKLMSAREKAKTDPAVVAAHQKLKDAKTPEDRRAAGEEMHKAMREAILKADPTLGPVLDQMKPPQPPKPPGPPGGMMDVQEMNQS